MYSDLKPRDRGLAHNRCARELAFPPLARLCVRQNTDMPFCIFWHVGGGEQRPRSKSAQGECKGHYFMLCYMNYKQGPWCCD